jgi:hypothetical protein
MHKHKNKNKNNKNIKTKTKNILIWDVLSPTLYPKIVHEYLGTMMNKPVSFLDAEQPYTQSTPLLM